MIGSKYLDYAEANLRNAMRHTAEANVAFTFTYDMSNASPNNRAWSVIYSRAKEHLAECRNREEVCAEAVRLATERLSHRVT